MFRQKRDNFIPLLSYRKYWLANATVLDMTVSMSGRCLRGGEGWSVEVRWSPVVVTRAQADRSQYSYGLNISSNIQIDTSAKTALLLSAWPLLRLRGQSRRHHSNVNLGSMLNINLSFHHKPKHKHCILLHADILFPSSILLHF